MAEPFELFKRPVDKKRMQSLFERTEAPLESSNIWYIHTVLTQCFLPYQDPKAENLGAPQRRFQHRLGGRPPARPDE